MSKVATMRYVAAAEACGGPQVMRVPGRRARTRSR